MRGSLKVIAESETKIEFTREDLAAIALDMPGISLGHLVCKRDDLEKTFKFEPQPTQYKDGFIDRLFEVHYTAKLMLHGVNGLPDASEENFCKDPGNKKIWSWMWHILKDEFKFNNFVINILTGEIYLDLDNAESS